MVFDNIFFLGSYGPSSNYRSQQPNMQVPNDLVLKLMEAQQVINVEKQLFSYLISTILRYNNGR